MNAWTAAALVLTAGAVPACLWGAASGSAVRRLTAVALLNTVMGGVFLLLPQGYDRSSYQDLALVLAVLAPAGTLVFTRFVAAQGHDGPGSTAGSDATTGTDGTDGTGGTDEEASG